MPLQSHVVKIHVVCSMSNGMNAKGTAEAAPAVRVQRKSHALQKTLEPGAPGGLVVRKKCFVTSTQGDTRHGRAIYHLKR